MGDETNLPFVIRSRVFVQKESPHQDSRRTPSKPLSEPTRIPAPDTPQNHEFRGLPVCADNRSPSESPEAARNLQQLAIRLPKKLKYHRCLRILKTLPMADPQELARVTNNLGRVLHDQQNYGEAEPCISDQFRFLKRQYPLATPSLQNGFIISQISTVPKEEMERLISCTNRWIAIFMSDLG